MPPPVPTFAKAGIVMRALVDGVKRSHKHADAPAISPYWLLFQWSQLGHSRGRHHRGGAFSKEVAPEDLVSDVSARGV
jgi:hypothetical protein